MTSQGASLRKLPAKSGPAAVYRIEWQNVEERGHHCGFGWTWVCDPVQAVTTEVVSNRFTSVHPMSWRFCIEMAMANCQLGYG